MTDERMIKKRRNMIIAIAFPVMMQNIVQHVMLLTDRAFLGNLNSRYLAAVGNVMIPYNAMLLMIFALATGLVVLVAQNVGAKDFLRAQRLGESSFVFSTLLSTGLFLVWFFLPKQIFTVFGASGAILRDAVAFVRILSVSLIFLGLEISVASILQGVGENRPIMFYGIVKSAINVLLDWLLIFGNWGFPAMGLQGAALATMAANIVGSVGLFATAVMLKELPFQISLRALLRPEWALYKETLAVGLPSGLESLLWNTGQLVLARLLNQIDSMAIGIHALVNGIRALPLLLYMGFAKATIAMVGQRYGEGDYKEARDTGLHCLKISLLISLSWTIVFELFPRQAARIFTSDAGVIARSVPLLQLSGIYVIFQAVNVVTGHAIRGTGDTKWMFYSQIFGTIFIIGVSAYVIFGLSWGLVGVYTTMILDELIRGIFNYWRFYKGENPFKSLIAAGRNLGS